MPFEPTERDRIVSEVLSQIKVAQIGTVTKVFEHSSGDDNSNHEVNVLLRDEDVERRRVPVAVSTEGEAVVPRVDDMVVVQFLDGFEEAPVVIGTIYNDVDRAPLGKEGIIRRRRGSVYTEMHPEGDWARTAVKSSDDGTPSTKVEVNDSDGTTKVNIETDGDINISAGGDVVIDEGGTAEKVAYQDHTHDYSGSTSDGASYSGTTTKPNEDGTKTEIE